MTSGALPSPLALWRHYPEQNPVLRGLLPWITTPAQIIAGREDDLVPWSNNEYLANQLPNGEIHPMNAGHFAWEQAPDEYGRLIVDWVTGGFQRQGRRGDGLKLRRTEQPSATRGIRCRGVLLAARRDPSVTTRVCSEVWSTCGAWHASSPVKVAVIVIDTSTFVPNGSSLPSLIGSRRRRWCRRRPPREVLARKRDGLCLAVSPVDEPRPNLQ